MPLRWCGFLTVVSGWVIMEILDKEGEILPYWIIPFLKKQVPAIQYLADKFGSIRHIDISNNKLVDAVGADIVKAVSILPNLEELYMHENKLGEQTMNAMIAGLPPSLTVLTLQHNELDFIPRSFLDTLPNLTYLSADRARDVSGLMKLRRLRLSVYDEECIKSTWVLPHCDQLEGSVSLEMAVLFNKGRSAMVNALLVFLQTSLPADTIKNLLRRIFRENEILTSFCDNLIG